MDISHVRRLDTVRQLEKFSTWLLKALIGAFAGGGAFLFLFAHLAAGVPLRRLLGPWLVYSGVAVACGPFIYLSLRHRATRGGDTRPLFAAVAVTLVLCSCILFYYASQLGIISPRDMRGLCVTAVVAVPVVTVLVYHLERRYFPLP